MLAFSGGADSSALLDMLLRSGFTVECAHLDHMIRGAEAERDREFCAEVCRERGVPIHTECVDVPARRASAARDLRRLRGASATLFWSA